MGSNEHLRLTASRGFTLIEVCLVIGLILALTTFVGISVVTVRNWQAGKDASLALQAVYAAQRSYMADHPTSSMSDVTAELLIPYLPQGWSSIPAVTGLSDESLTIDHSTIPPRLLSSGAVYDPSGKSDDGLWDLGK